MFRKLTQGTANAVCLLTLMFVTSHCGSQETGEKKMEIGRSLVQVPTSRWSELKDLRIYFGHQSVGDNIVRGLQEVMQGNEAIALNIQGTPAFRGSRGGIFAHSKVGENKKPQSKIDAFDGVIRQNGGDIDVAMLKLCFVDIDSGSNVEKLFAYYKETMDGLARDYPDITFVHSTVPLIRREKESTLGRIKKFAGRLLGRTDRGFFDDEHNITRNRYNELLRSQYDGGHVFDIAEIESTYADGGREAFTRGKEVYYALVREYTPDAGHLNETGRRRAAEGMLLLLLDISEIKAGRQQRAE